MKFNHLNVPTHWQNYWTRYPEGHTILEALISWVSQVDSMVDNQNKLNDNVEQFRNEIDAFIGRFDERLQTEVTQTLNEWQNSGFLDIVISEALQWQLDDYITTNEQDKLSLNAQLAQISIFVEEFGAVGDGETDDTKAIQDAIVYAKNVGGATILFDSKTYMANMVSMTDCHGVHLKGNNTIIQYNGDSLDSGFYMDGKLFYIDRSENVSFEGLVLKGRLFYGLDKNNLPITPVNNIYTKNDRHIGIFMLGSKNVTIDNVTFQDFMSSFYAGGECERISFKDSVIRDTFFGVQWYTVKNSTIKNVSVYDARFELYPANSTTGTIGSGGTSFLIDRCNDLTIDGVYYENSATDGIRVQGGSKNIKVLNATSYRSRRHAFSIYHGGNEVTFKNCKAINTQDSDFWNGSDYVNTFKRPSQVGSGSSYTIAQGDSDNFNRIVLDSCRAEEKTYTVKPVATGTELFKNVALTRLMSLAAYNYVSVSNCYLEGYTEMEGVLIDSSETIFANNTIIANPFITGMSATQVSLNVTGTRNQIKDNRINNGYFGITSNNIGYGSIFDGNYIRDTASRGIYVLGGNSLYFTNNVIENIGQNGSETPAMQFVNTTNTTCGYNVVIDERAERKTATAMHIATSAYLFEPGVVTVIGGTISPTDINGDAPFNTFRKRQLGKIPLQGLSQAGSVEVLRNDFNALLNKLRSANLMDADV